MRGQEKDVKTLTLSGKVFLKYEEDEAIAAAEKGDIFLYLHTDNTDKVLIKGDYHSRGYAGYFKSDIYDGKAWQIMDINDFCEEKENHFKKSERSIDTYNLCSELLRQQAGTVVYKGYRGGHYSTYLHQSNPFKGKKGKFSK